MVFLTVPFRLLSWFQVLWWWGRGLKLYQLPHHLNINFTSLTLTDDDVVDLVHCLSIWWRPSSLRDRLVDDGTCNNQVIGGAEFNYELSTFILHPFSPIMISLSLLSSLFSHWGLPWWSSDLFSVFCPEQLEATLSIYLRSLYLWEHSIWGLWLLCPWSWI